jgi:hypothetical protein
MRHGYHRLVVMVVAAWLWMSDPQRMLAREDVKCDFEAKYCSGCYATENAIGDAMRRDLSEAFVYFVLSASKNMPGASGSCIRSRCVRTCTVVFDRFVVRVGQDYSNGDK